MRSRKVCWRLVPNRSVSHDGSEEICVLSKIATGVIVVMSLFAYSAGGLQPPETRLLVDRESLKVVAARSFPQDLACEIFVGPPGEPEFVTKGGGGQVKNAGIDLGVGRPSVSFVRRDTRQRSYVLYLFLDRPGQPVSGLFDLNLDGEWDVRKIPPKQFIRVGAEWVEVDSIDGITEEKTTAVRGTTQFVFDKDKWISRRTAPVR
jgi:hypothetical protein